MKTLHLAIIVVSLIVLPFFNIVSAQTPYSEPQIKFGEANYFPKKLYCNDIPPFCPPNPAASNQVTIIITDSHANRFSTIIDQIPVHIWSDSDRTGIDAIAYETQKDSGIFDANVTITDDQSMPGKIHVSDGDTLSVKYVYPALSQDGKLALHEMMATSFIGWTGPPLERVATNDFKLEDNNGQDTSHVNVNQQVQIASSLLNSNRTQPFAYVIQIQNENQVTVLLSWIAGTLEPRQSIDVSQMWTPTISGNYTVTGFVWQSIDNPNALSPPLLLTVEVR
jgi:hypothetical protein